MPLIYLGDEVAQLNDDAFADDPDHRADSRWVHRPRRPEDRYAQRHDPTTTAGRVFGRLRELIERRRATPEFAGNALVPFHTSHVSVLGFTRPGAGDAAVLVLANVGDHSREVAAPTFAGLDRKAVDIVTGGAVDLGDGVALAPHGFVWLRVRMR